jgi:hypothetical protein
MFLHNIAYRHLNGEVEGFIGIGSNKDVAKADANRQIQRKLSMFQNPQILNMDRVITNPNKLSIQELKQVKQNWNTMLRY